MEFSPINMINNQYSQSNNKCTIEKCLKCPIKNTCRHYIEHLENRVIGGSINTDPIQNSSIDISQLLSHIDSLTTRVNELTTIVINTANVPQSDSQIIQQSYSSDISKTTNVSTVNIDPSMDMQTVQVEHLQNNNNTDENKSQDVEIISKENVENGLVVYDSEKPKKIWVEKTNIFGQKTGKFKEIKPK